MSQSEHKPGSILRVRCQNFLTYADVEFFPGARLNVVIGPNGSGKSTILCAICLGLGGSPVLLGRADDVRTFIMHEKDRGFIEIELQSRTSSKLIIRRSIDRSLGKETSVSTTSSTWTLNGVKSSQKAVKAIVVEDYKIMVDNLCVFLPQDHVGSFSGFNCQKLLTETEKALSREQLYDKHMELITMQKESSSTKLNKQTIAERLAELKAENEALERQREKLEERKKFERKLEVLVKKKMWLDMDTNRKKCLELKEEKETLKTAYNTANASCIPLKEKLETLTKVGEKQSSSAKMFYDGIKQSKKDLEKHQDKVDKFDSNIEDDVMRLNELNDAQEKAERKANAAAEKLEELKSEFAKKPSLGPLDKQYQDCTAKYTTLNQQLGKLDRKSRNIGGEFRTAKDVCVFLEKDLKDIKDSRKTRWNKILQGLNSNKRSQMQQIKKFISENNFRKTVLGPIALEVTCKNQTAAMYIESHLPFSKSTTFVVQCQEDYDFLFKKIRQEKNIPINIDLVTSSSQSGDSQRSYSAQRFSSFKKNFGVVGYLDEQIEAPPAVVESLKMTQFDKVIIGGRATLQAISGNDQFMNELAKREPNHPQANSLQASILMYSNNVSRYSGRINMNVKDIPNNTNLYSTGTPKETISLMENKLADQKQKMNEISNEDKENNVELEKSERASKKAQDELMACKAEMSDIRKLKQRIDQQQKKVEELRAQAARDFEADMSKQLRTIQKTLQTSAKELDGSSDKYDALMDNTFKAGLAKMTQEGTDAQSRSLNQVIQDIEVEAFEFKKRYEKAKDEFTKTKAAFKKIQNECLQKAPLVDPVTNEELPLKKKIDELPDELETIDALIDEANIKVNSIEDNPEVAIQYEQRQEEIRNIEEELKTLNASENMQEAEASSLESSWLLRLKNQLDKVNSRFGRYMEALSCAGEIKLYKGEDESEEYKDWGVKINVRFRQASGLQALSAQVHSGGERSVSTILYLMALQDMLVSPVRCVDEINQGMDEVNERSVFKRIVSNSCKAPKDLTNPTEHSGQYFLITPKLLPNLDGLENEEITVLTIFNGTRSFPNYNDWNVEKYLRRKRKLDSGGAAMNGHRGGAIPKKKR
ncbi:hypothetical protein ScalyP_jg1988 [Parmales sp. scaly parma]|nr:hypothetical protein ScalyP_jg1988 [Parmales sp. scaly parma]